MEIVWQVEPNTIFGTVEFLTVGNVDVGNMRNRKDGRVEFVGHARGVGFFTAKAKSAVLCKAAVIRHLRKAGVPC